MSDNSDSNSTYVDPYPIWPLDLEHAPYRAIDFGMRSLQLSIFAGQVGNWLQMKAASVIAFKDYDLKSSATYAMNMDAFETAIEDPAIFISTLAAQA